MFSAWGHVVYRFRWLVLAVSLVLLAASAYVASRGGPLESGSFIQTAEAGRAAKLIEQELPRAGGSTFTLVFSSTTLSAADPAFQKAVADAVAPLRADRRVDMVQTPYDASPAAAAALVSGDGRSVAVSVAVKDDIGTALGYYQELRDSVRSDALAVQATGVLAIDRDFNDILQQDLRRAETVSLPLALLLLLVVFGTVVAALLPLGVGIFAVLGGVAGMYALTRVTTVSVFAENVITLIGLGVAIDYSLFVANRFREELHRGRTTEDAVATAVATSGRAITFSGLTVAIGLTGMLWYEGTYLSSMGLAGSIVVAAAVFYGLTFLPALLSVIGKRVDLVRIPILASDPTGRGLWHALATTVMRRPFLVLVPVVALILLVGSPFLGLRLALGSVDMLPKRAESRAAYEKLTADFPGAGQNNANVLAYFPDGSPLAPSRIPDLIDLQKRLEGVRGVQTVQSPFADPRVTPQQYAQLFALPREQWPPELRAAVTQLVGERIVLFSVVTSDKYGSDAARQLVRDIRALAPPAGAELLVGGFAAIDLDTVDFIAERTPLAIGYIVAATILVLFLLLGSAVLPLKAVVMNLLSISASFGALVWVFQEGNLSEQLGFVASGSLDPTLPVIMFATLFGLSMDYEVLLLSRIQEEYARLGDNTAAVAEGLERSGRLITGAAAIMVAVFAAFGLAEIVIIKAIGLGMALAVAIDATLVRALVVPATMRLLGRWNWWAPGPLARLYRRAGLGGS